MESRVIKVSRGTPPHRRLSIVRHRVSTRDIGSMISAIGKETPMITAIADIARCRLTRDIVKVRMTNSTANIARCRSTMDIASTTRLTHIVRNSSTRDIASEIRRQMGNTGSSLEAIARMMGDSIKYLEIIASMSERQMRKEFGRTFRMGARLTIDSMIEDIGDSMKLRTFVMLRQMGAGLETDRTFRMGDSMTMDIGMGSRNSAAGRPPVSCLIIFSLRVRWASIPQGLMGRP